MNEQKKTDKDALSRRAYPLVFISHDTRDAEFAEAFSVLLKSVSAGVLKSFRSSDRKGNQGIEYGIEWYPEIIKNIQEASDVVCLLTERSINRPWLLFEAGMAKGKLETPILGVALGVSLSKASSGPFAQFQNCGDDEDSLMKLVYQLVERIPNSEPDEKTIRYQVREFKKTILKLLQENNGKNITEIENQFDHGNSSARLFEEIKIMFNDLPKKIEDSIFPDRLARSRRYIDARMIKSMILSCDNNYVSTMILLSIYKDPMPWLYEIGIEAIRIFRSPKTSEEKMTYLSDFEKLLENSTHNLHIRKFVMESEDDFSLMIDLPRMLMENMYELLKENIET